jgi:hypothetical protein
MDSGFDAGEVAVQFADESRSGGKPEEGLQRTLRSIGFDQKDRALSQLNERAANVCRQLSGDCDGPGTREHQHTCAFDCQAGGKHKSLVG